MKRKKLTLLSSLLYSVTHPQSLDNENIKAVSATSSSSDPPGDVIVMNIALLALLSHYNNAAAVQPARG